MKPHLSSAKVQLIPYTVILAASLYSLGSANAMPNEPDFSKLLLSVHQQNQIRNIQSVMQHQILNVLDRNQQAQLDATLAQRQSLQQGLTTLDLSKPQQSKVKTIMKTQMQKIFKLMNTGQRLQLMRRSPWSPSFYL